MSANAKEKDDERHIVEQICEKFFLASAGCNDRAAILSALVFLCSAYLVEAAQDEGHLLDGIKLTNDDIRALACDMFVRYRPHK